MASLVGNASALPALNPGARVEDAAGRAIGRVRAVRRDGAGPAGGRDGRGSAREHAAPAGNLSANGNVLVSGSGSGTATTGE
ncbi:hypothetical protein AB5I41_19315 [Sphingomonas sp. MMS24-JH45]